MPCVLEMPFVLAIPVCFWHLTPAVSRANSWSDAGAEAVGVGSSALFGPGFSGLPCAYAPLRTLSVPWGGQNGLHGFMGLMSLMGLMGLMDLMGCGLVMAFLGFVP